MTALDCSVSTCGYNSDRCCCRSQIDVKGTKADHNDDTCCGSFRKESDEFQNSVRTPNENLSISCEAANCIYNDAKICNAEHIDISGTSANSEDQTLFSSFTY
jgi:hypothetical protein